MFHTYFTKKFGCNTIIIIIWLKLFSAIDILQEAVIVQCMLGNVRQTLVLVIHKNPFTTMYRNRQMQWSHDALVLRRMRWVISARRRTNFSSNKNKTLTRHWLTLVHTNLLPNFNNISKLKKMSGFENKTNRKRQKSRNLECRLCRLEKWR